MKQLLCVRVAELILFFLVTGWPPGGTAILFYGAEHADRGKGLVKTRCSADKCCFKSALFNSAPPLSSVAFIYTKQQLGQKKSQRPKPLRSSTNSSINSPFLLLRT